MTRLLFSAQRTGFDAGNVTDLEVLFDLLLQETRVVGQRGLEPVDLSVDLHVFRGVTVVNPDGNYSLEGARTWTKV